MAFLELRSLTPSLLPAALELDQRCFGGLWTAEGYQRELESPNSELLVLVEDKGQRTGDRGQGTEVSDSIQPSDQDKDSLLTPHLIGLGCYWAILEEAHITILAIDPAYQRQGLGQVLLYTLLASAHQRGLERATLEVRISNQSAIALYTKFGFREAGRRRKYYQDTGEDALVLWRGGLNSPEFPQILVNWWKESHDRLQRSAWLLSTGWEQLHHQPPRLTCL